jgi:hypothetical protein
MSLADPSGLATRNNPMLGAGWRSSGGQPAVTSSGVLTGKSESAAGARDFTSSTISSHGADRLGYRFSHK